MPTAKDLLEVLSDKVLIGDGCWEWMGYRTPKGYGGVAIKNKTHRAHRVVYELLVGPIPVGLDLDHICRNRGCVRPDHLEPVTCKENLMRGLTHAALNAAKTHCPHGHLYDEKNTILKKSGTRLCRECNKIQCRAYSKAHPRRH